LRYTKVSDSKKRNQLPKQPVAVLQIRGERGGGGGKEKMHP